MSRHPALKTLGATVAGVALLAALAARGMFPVRVRGNSMRPALEPGDLLAVAPRRDAVVPRGAIVVLRREDGLEIVKRAVAVSGDVYGGARIADGYVFVAGDNTGASTDSRTFGPIPLQAVEGVARLVYWPPRRWRLV